MKRMSNYLKKRTVWKKVINEHGIEKVLINPTNYLRLKPKYYSLEHIRQLRYKLKKRYGTTGKE